MTGLISIIIPSLNSPLIDQVLIRLLKQTEWEQIIEILVVGKDEPNLIRPSYPKTRLIDTGRPVNAPTARNIGMQEAKGEIFLFVDSDCLPHERWAEGHLEAHQAGHDVVIGSVDPVSHSYWGYVYNLTLFHEFLNRSDAGSRSIPPTLNLSVKRSVVDRIGEMDRTFKRAEDVEWGTRMVKAGITPYFEPSAVVEHHHNRHSFRPVWLDCAISGYYSRQVRLRQEHEQGTLSFNGMLQFPWLVLLGAPLIALLVTLKIVGRHIPLFFRQPLTIPGIYLTKLAWCWGASRTQWI